MPDRLRSNASSDPQKKDGGAPSGRDRIRKRREKLLLTPLPRVLIRGSSRLPVHPASESQAGERSATAAIRSPNQHTDPLRGETHAGPRPSKKTPRRNSQIAHHRNTNTHKSNLAAPAEHIEKTARGHKPLDETPLLFRPLPYGVIRKM